MKQFVIISLAIGLLLHSACMRNESAEVYHRFPSQTWQRFDILKFEVPVRESGQDYDVWFFIRTTRKYPYNDLNFNMVMNTTSGEERIREYTLQVNRAGGGLAEPCTQDSCTYSLVLKSRLHCSITGILKIDIENLTPRMRTEGILGAGIRLTKTRG